MSRSFMVHCVYMGCTLAPPADTTEPSMCGGDVDLCQITLTNCVISDWYVCLVLCITRWLSWHCKRTDLTWCSRRSS